MLLPMLEAVVIPRNKLLSMQLNCLVFEVLDPSPLAYINLDLTIGLIQAATQNSYH